MRRVTVAVALVLLLAPVPVIAASPPTPPDPSTIEGTVTDVLGAPLEACVYVRPIPVGTWPATVYPGTTTKTLTEPETGAYRLEVTPGRYQVWAYSPFEVSDWHPDPCRDPFWGRINNEEFVGQGPRTVDTLTAAPVDFALEYYLAGGAYGRHCCIGNGLQPGDDAALLAWTSRRLRGDARVFWKDHTTGTEIELPYDRPMWISLYDRYGCTPADDASGRCVDSPVTTFTYTGGHARHHYSFWAETLDGIRVTPVHTGAIWVDTVAPEIIATEPADGAADHPADRGVWLEASDEGSGLWSARLTVWDVADDSEPVHRARFSFFSGNHDRAWTSVPFEAGHTYRARFDVTDNADHATSRTITFSTIEPPAPCNLVCQVGRPIGEATTGVGGMVGAGPSTAAGPGGPTTPGPDDPRARWDHPIGGTGPS